MRIAFFASVAALALAAVASAEETVENPEFVGWAKFKTGTSITMKTNTSAGMVKSEITSTSTLVELGADKLVIETATVSKFNGMEFKAPPVKRDVKKMIPLAKGQKLEDVLAKKPAGAYEEGTEAIKVGAAEIKATWYKVKADAAGNKTESKMWMSDDVPGGLVKMETTTSGMVTSTLKMELVEIKTPQ